MKQYITYRLVAKLRSGAITPWQSDTIFGGFCAALSYLHGEPAVEDFLGGYHLGVPKIIFSNGYPGDLLPKPLYGLGKTKAPRDKASLLEQIKEGKRVKKAAYLTLEQFLDYQNGKAFKVAPIANPIISTDTYHNQLDRITGTTGETGALYFQSEWFAASGMMSAYLKIIDGFEEETKKIFETLGQVGLGKKRSIGKGSFTVLDFRTFPEFEKVDTPNAYVSLSNFVPAAGDPAEGCYKTMIKYGKMEPGRPSPNPFKQPLLMINAGAVFKLGNGFKPFYGRMVEKIAADDRVCHYGMAFAVPARIDWE